MHKRPTFYLGHPFNRREEIRLWELGFEAKHDVELLNPFYDVNREDVLDKDNDAFYPREKHYKKLVEDDINLIKDSDYLLAFISNPITIGTTQEIVYAKNMGKRVFVILSAEDKTTEDELKKIRNHPWLRYHSDRIFLGKEEFEDHISKNYP